MLTPGTTTVHCVVLLHVPTAGTPKKVNNVCPGVVLKAVPVMEIRLPASAESGVIPVIVGKTSYLN
jgi:hypothetical protein